MSENKQDKLEKFSEALRQLVGDIAQKGGIAADEDVVKFVAIWQSFYDTVNQMSEDEIAQAAPQITRFHVASCLTTAEFIRQQPSTELMDKLTPLFRFYSRILDMPVPTPDPETYQAVQFSKFLTSAFLMLVEAITVTMLNDVKNEKLSLEEATRLITTAFVNAIARITEIDKLTNMPDWNDPSVPVA